MNDFSGDYEIIVVDDGSSDGTRGIVERFAEDVRTVRLIRYETGGRDMRCGRASS